MKTHSKLVLRCLLFAVFFVIGCAGDGSKASTEEAEETTETKDTTSTPGQVLYVVHDVADYDVWKAGYDGYDSLRLANGLQKIAVGKNLENPDRIHVLLSADDLEKVKTFAGSEDLKKAMEDIGVVGPPEIYIFRGVYNDPDPIEITQRVVVIHEVEDYDKWKTVFDEHKPNREQSSLIDRALLRDTDNPNKVMIIMAYKDRESVDAFMTSDELKNTMEKAGVVGEPDIQFINWEELINE